MTTFVRKMTGEEISAAVAEWLHRRGFKPTTESMTWRAEASPPTLTMDVQVTLVEPLPTAYYNLRKGAK